MKIMRIILKSSREGYTVKNGYGMKKEIEKLLLLFFLLFMTEILSEAVYQKAEAAILTTIDAESETFRSCRFTEDFLQQLHQMNEQTKWDTSELLTILKTKNQEVFRNFPKDCSKEYLLEKKSRLQKYNHRGYETVRNLYSMLFDDLKHFPTDPAVKIVYENTWMFERTYGGKRGHEGTDLVPEQNIAGYYKICSVTDGIVEQVGWLEKGGYRIGIRAPSGGYFYYAHLDSYSKEYRVGDAVSAGEVLGLMGDTGYGPEGTKGQFNVHLHFGIYIRTEDQKEISVNPYWILRYLEQIVYR